MESEERQNEIVTVLQEAYEHLMGAELPVIRDLDPKFMASVMQTKKHAKEMSKQATTASAVDSDASTPQ